MLPLVFLSFFHQFYWDTEGIVNPEVRSRSCYIGNGKVLKGGSSNQNKKEAGITCKKASDCRSSTKSLEHVLCGRGASDCIEQDPFARSLGLSSRQRNSVLSEALSLSSNGHTESAIMRRRGSDATDSMQNTGLQCLSHLKWWFLLTIGPAIVPASLMWLGRLCSDIRGFPDLGLQDKDHIIPHGYSLAVGYLAIAPFTLAFMRCAPSWLMPILHIRLERRKQTSGTGRRWRFSCDVRKSA